MSSSTPLKRGTFFVLEGIDGCGKTTCAPYLLRLLKDAGMPAVATREVGGTHIGGRLRSIIYKDETDEALDPIARLLLVVASRIQNIKTFIEPHLAAGTSVVCDRFSDSTWAYQGMEDRLNFAIKDLEQIEELKFSAMRPDYLLHFQLSAETSVARGITRGTVDNSLYKNNLTRTQRVAKSYQERMDAMALRHPSKKIVNIDAELSPEEVKAQLVHFVKCFKASQAA